MDLETLRAKMAENRASLERIAKDEAAAREALAAISKATKTAETYAHDKALLAVIDPSADAKTAAERAKANLAAAFARETEIRDTFPLLAAARQKLEDEIEQFRRDIKVAEDTKVVEVISAGLNQVDAEIVSITGRLFARARARGTAGWGDLVELLKDRIHGSSDGLRPSLRDRIIAEAEKVRANIASGRA
jgi:hypothetical protein